MSDLAKLLQEHSATKLLHDPTRHVCNGCGQPITSTMAEHQADVLDLAGYEASVAGSVPGWAHQLDMARSYLDGYDRAWAYWGPALNKIERLRDKTADRLRASRALVREQRDTIAAQDALIDGMRKTLMQQRAMAETLVALS